MKYYSFVVTLLLFIPYLFDLLEQGGSNINEILNDFLIQTINGFFIVQSIFFEPAIRTVQHNQRRKKLNRRTKKISSCPNIPEYVQRRRASPNRTINITFAL